MLGCCGDGGIKKLKILSPCKQQKNFHDQCNAIQYDMMRWTTLNKPISISTFHDITNAPTLVPIMKLLLICFIYDFSQSENIQVIETSATNIHLFEVNV